LGIAISTLYHWLHLFPQQASLLLSAFEQISWVSHASLHLIESFVSLPSLFFSRYRFSFLQHPFRHALGGG
jgi:hypothetical protein